MTPGSSRDWGFPAIDVVAGARFVVVAKLKNLEMWAVCSDREVVDTEWSRRLESESSVVVGIAEHHDQWTPSLVQLTKEFSHEGSADALALTVRSNRQRGDAGYSKSVELSERCQHLSDDLPAGDGNQIACRNRGVEGPDGFDDLDLLATVAGLARECLTDGAKHLGSIVLGRGAY